MTHHLNNDKTFVTKIINNLNTEIRPQNGQNTEGSIDRNPKEINRLKIFIFFYLVNQPCHVFEKARHPNRPNANRFVCDNEIKQFQNYFLTNFLKSSKR